MENKYWDDEFGWGDITFETEHFIIVRFDSDPWCFHQIAKKEN